MNVLEFANEYLLKPLGIEPRTNANCTTAEDQFAYLMNKGNHGKVWFMDPKDMPTAGWGLSLSAYEMAQMAKESVIESTNLMEKYDRDIVEDIIKQEKKVDKYEDKISAYLVQLASENMNAEDSHQVTKILHIVGDIERISDHALNIAEAAKEVFDKQIHFSAKAKEDIGIMASAVEEILDLSTKTLADEDLQSAKHVEPLEQVIDRLKRKIKSGHISRLRQGDCTMELGFVLSDILNNFERISDHCSNIAVCIIETTNDSFEVHEYLNQLKSNGEEEFSSMYESYKQKYAIH
jgi:phosphate:Na+ symporter